MPIWNAGSAECGLTHCVTVPVQCAYCYNRKYFLPPVQIVHIDLLFIVITSTFMNIYTHILKACLEIIMVSECFWYLGQFLELTYQTLLVILSIKEYVSFGHSCFTDLGITIVKNSESSFSICFVNEHYFLGKMSILCIGFQPLE